MTWERDDGDAVTKRVGVHTQTEPNTLEANPRSFFALRVASSAGALMRLACAEPRHSGFEPHDYHNAPRHVVDADPREGCWPSSGYGRRYELSFRPVYEAAEARHKRRFVHSSTFHCECARVPPAPATTALRAALVNRLSSSTNLDAIEKTARRSVGRREFGENSATRSGQFHLSLFLVLSVAGAGHGHVERSAAADNGWPNRSARRRPSPRPARNATQRLFDAQIGFVRRECRSLSRWSVIEARYLSDARCTFLSERRCEANKTMARPQCGTELLLLRQQSALAQTCDSVPPHSCSLAPLRRFPTGQSRKSSHLGNKPLAVWPACAANNNGPVSTKWYFHSRSRFGSRPYVASTKLAALLMAMGGGCACGDFRRASRH